MTSWSSFTILTVETNMAGNLDVETIMKVVLLLPRPVARSGISINPELINFN